MPSGFIEWRVTIACSAPNKSVATARAVIQPACGAVPGLVSHGVSGVGPAWFEAVIIRMEVSIRSTDLLSRSLRRWTRAGSRFCSFTVYRRPPDGRAVAFVDNRDGLANLWTQPIAGGTPVKLTHFTANGISSFAWSHTDDRLPPHGEPTPTMLC